MSPCTIRLLGTFKTDEGFEAELTDWTGEIDPSVNNITGRFMITERFTNVLVRRS